LRLSNALDVPARARLGRRIVPARCGGQVPPVTGIGTETIIEAS
jgi:hypothetical protein